MRSNNESHNQPRSETADKFDDFDFDQQPEPSFWDNPVEKISRGFRYSSYSQLIGYFIGAVITVALTLAFPLNWINLGILAATGGGVGAINKIKGGSLLEGVAYGIVGSIVLTSFLSLVVPHMLSALLFYGILPARFVAPMLASWPLIQTFLPMGILAGGAIAECFKDRPLIKTFDFLSTAIVKLTTRITTKVGEMISAVINRCCPTLFKEEGFDDENKRRPHRNPTVQERLKPAARAAGYSKPRSSTEARPPHQPPVIGSRQDQAAQGTGFSREPTAGDRQPPAQQPRPPSPTNRG